VPKITDFGLAKLIDGQATASQSADGPGPGTLFYMAPEQAAGHASQVGPRTDVHALGVLLYEMLTGAPPFQGPTLADTLSQIQTQRPVPPNRLQPTVPAPLARVCLKCLEKRPSRRYASARQVAEDIEDFLQGQSLRHARPESFREWLVDLFSQSSHVEHFGDLGRVHLWMAPVELFVHLGVFFLLGLAWAEPAVWLLLFVTYAVLFGLIYHIDSRRVRLLTPVEHLARLLWVGHLLGYAAVCLGYRLTTSDYATAVRLSYPTLGVLTGLAYLVLGGTYWSRYYLFACTWFVVALLLALAPAWAPLVCGLYHGASGLAVGWWLWRAGRENRLGEAR
jgi:hypothetical protein